MDKCSRKFFRGWAASFLFLLVTLLSVVSSCPTALASDVLIPELQPQESKELPTPPVGAATPPAPPERLIDLDGYSAWIAEWAMQPGLREANSQKRGLESVQMFAAYFDKNDQPYLPPSLLRWIDRDAESFRAELLHIPLGVRIPIYLSVVNDISDPDSDAGSVFKDPDLVTRLVGSKEARATHISDLLDLLDQGPFDGLDIDYERVRAEDWENFLLFCEELYEVLQGQDKLLRVVLEPKKIYYEKPFPEGPEYVLMAYNLFGGHSGPGPKANPEFIARLAGWTASMEPQPRFALATGGFLWDTAKKQSDNDRVQSLTESEAHLIAQREGIKPERDEESKYLFFSYPEGDKKPKTVWYADGETLAYLARSAKERGFDTFALWRFGGNRRFSLDAWRTEVTREQWQQ